jgi:hypothetical protein
VWNRQRFRKNPETDTRVSRLNAATDWVRAPAPAPRIIDQATFAAVQARRAGRAGHARRP